MRIAYFIGIHKNAAQFGRLLGALYRDCDQYFVHIDQKQSESFCAEVANLIAAWPNVHLLPRLSVTWAGWSQCEMELAALGLACLSGQRWDYWINLSGQDYPIKPVQEIADFLSAEKGKNFIDSRAIQQLEPQLRRVVKRRYQWLALEWGGRTRRLPLPTGAILSNKLTTYGSSWHMLSRGYCDWVAATGNKMAKIMRFTKSSDEFLHQFLIEQSPFADSLDLDNRRFYIFDGRPNPEILTGSHFDQLAGSNAFFARKFDPEQSKELMDRIDDELLIEHEMNVPEPEKRRIV
ncbi:MAG: beta-1,6-N-acetylglucosaminyltransferase [Pseudomonadota bacterium]